MSCIADLFAIKTGDIVQAPAAIADVADIGISIMHICYSDKIM